MNSQPIDPLRPLGEPPSMGDGPLSQVPLKRLALWSIFALLVITGIVLFFLYGDFVAPVLVMHDGSASREFARIVSLHA